MIIIIVIISISIVATIIIMVVVVVIFPWLHQRRGQEPLLGVRQRERRSGEGLKKCGVIVSVLLSFVIVSVLLLYYFVYVCFLCSFDSYVALRCNNYGAFPGPPISENDFARA